MSTYSCLYIPLNPLRSLAIFHALKRSSRFLSSIFSSHSLQALRVAKNLSAHRATLRDWRVERNRRRQSRSALARNWASSYLTAKMVASWWALRTWYHLWTIWAVRWESDRATKFKASSKSSTNESGNQKLERETIRVLNCPWRCWHRDFQMDHALFMIWEVLNRSSRLPRIRALHTRSTAQIKKWSWRATYFTARFSFLYRNRQKTVGTTLVYSLPLTFLMLISTVWECASEIFYREIYQQISPLP